MLTQQQLEIAVNEITLTHMQMKVDWQKVVLEDYPGAERDFALGLVQGYFFQYKRLLGEDSVRVDLLEKALRYSKFNAVRRITTEFHDLVDRTVTFLLDEAERTRWFSNDDFGHDSLEELLASIVDAQEEGTSSYYDWSFIASKVLPLARSMNIDLSTIMSASLQTRKLRSFVPAARVTLRQLEEGLIDEDQAKEAFTWGFGIVADSKISNSNAVEQFNVYRGKTVTILDPVITYKVFLPGGYEWLIVAAKSNSEVRAAEMALGKLVDIHLMDLGELASLLTRKIRGEI